MDDWGFREQSKAYEYDCKTVSLCRRPEELPSGSWGVHSESQNHKFVAARMSVSTARAIHRGESAAQSRSWITLLFTRMGKDSDGPSPWTWTVTDGDVAIPYNLQVTSILLIGIIVLKGHTFDVPNLPLPCRVR